MVRKFLFILLAALALATPVDLAGSVQANPPQRTNPRYVLYYRQDPSRGWIAYAVYERQVDADLQAFYLWYLYQCEVYILRY